MSHRNGRGIRYRHAAGAALLWAITAGVCHQLGGCGTIEGVGRDLQASSQMVRQWVNRKAQRHEGTEAQRGEVADAR